MFKSIATVLGRLALLLVSALLLASASLFVMGSYLLTWPILRKSPRERHLTAAMNLASACMTMMMVVSQNTDQGYNASSEAGATSPPAGNGVDASGETTETGIR